MIIIIINTVLVSGRKKNNKKHKYKHKQTFLTPLKFPDYSILSRGHAHMNACQPMGMPQEAKAPIMRLQ